MMDPIDDTYTTLKNIGEGIFKDRGSKFLAFAQHVENEEEIARLLSFYRKKYFDARHHCYAWMLGPKRNHFRSSDDGEPAGTAGKPILNQILSAEITDVLVVVIRWFGGVKLGTSGLIQAYKEAAKEAIFNAEKIHMTVDVFVSANFPYALINEVMRICKEWQVVPTLNYLPENIFLSCRVRMRSAKSFVNQLSALHGLKLIEKGGITK